VPGGISSSLFFLPLLLSSARSDHPQHEQMATSVLPLFFLFYPKGEEVLDLGFGPTSFFPPLLPFLV